MKLRRISKWIDAPLKAVYSWCTDFSLSESDTKASGFQRRILERTSTRCVFVDVIGRSGKGPKLALNLVNLSPPRSWHLDFFGDPRNETVDYRLTRLGRGSTRLDMTFKVGLSRAERAGFQALWDKYASEIVEEYRSRSR